MFDNQRPDGGLIGRRFSALHADVCQQSVEDESLDAVAGTFVQFFYTGGAFDLL